LNVALEVFIALAVAVSVALTQDNFLAGVLVGCLISLVVVELELWRRDRRG
jgi:hypothetical protein